ncbi:AMP-binding protein [Candidatus Sumerlaeota bacterium]|nr:AMP-binding protein [Candidatus Sumerlaeota bacterium]
MEQTIIHELIAKAGSRPDDLAYSVSERDLTYSALWEETRRAAADLAANGVSRGDRIALCMPTSPSLITLIYATQLAGAIPTIMNHHIPPASIMARAAQIESKMMICEEGFASQLTAAAPNAKIKILTLEALNESRAPVPPEFQLPSPDDISHMQITSGTGGEPRAAIIRHGKLLKCIRAWSETMGLKDSDVFVSWVPLYHDMGLVRFVFQPIHDGYPCHLLQATIRNFRPWLETITRVRGTITGGPDFAYRIAARLVDPAGLDLKSVRIAINGGEPVRMSTIELFERRFDCPGGIRPGYGMAEATLSISMARPGEALRQNATGHVSNGQPVNGLEIKIVDDDGRELPAGTEGEITISCGHLFDGYYGDEGATRQALRDGRLYTGDMGMLDADGHIYILGRKRAMIKRSGAMIAPREVEEAVDRVPGVKLSAAIGFDRPETDGTEDLAVIAEVDPEKFSGAAARADLCARISESVRGVIGAAPGEVMLVQPRTILRPANGKIRHYQMKLAYAAGELEPKRLR